MEAAVEHTSALSALPEQWCCAEDAVLDVVDVVVPVVAVVMVFVVDVSDCR
jgi:hypothetical protein